MNSIFSFTISESSKYESDTLAVILSFFDLVKSAHVDMKIKIKKTKIFI